MNTFLIITGLLYGAMMIFAGSASWFYFLQGEYLHAIAAAMLFLMLKK